MKSDTDLSTWFWASLLCLLGTDCWAAVSTNLKRPFCTVCLRPLNSATAVTQSASNHITQGYSLHSRPSGLFGRHQLFFAWLRFKACRVLLQSKLTVSNQSLKLDCHVAKVKTFEFQDTRTEDQESRVEKDEICGICKTREGLKKAIYVSKK